MKVLGIGLPRTATTSLATALNLLGVNTLHSAHYIHPDIIYDLNHSIYENYDGLCDTPFFNLYKEYDKKFPKTKFIYTIRPKDKWLISFENLYKADYNKWSNNTHLHHIKLYGQKEFDKEIWGDYFDKHNEGVVSYFKGREDDLLIIDITNNTSEENWKQICDFLNLPIPNIQFPNINHLNQNK